MTPSDECFMALEGLVQWTVTVVWQGERISQAMKCQSEAFGGSYLDRRQATHIIHSECHFFAISANKVFEYRDWVMKLGLCKKVDFSMLDAFNKQDIRDLRNMREHVIEYFKGRGHVPARWISETPNFSADASSLVGTKIGGRLDWAAFTEAAQHLLPALLEEPLVMK